MTIDQDKDVLAAEYVLGTLGPDERAEAQALLAVEPAFAEVVRGWERRLGELSAMVDPVEPPADMWDRIKAGIAVSEKMTPAPAAARTPEPAAGAVKAPAEAPKTAPREVAASPPPEPPAAAAAPAVPAAAGATPAAAAPAGPAAAPAAPSSAAVPPATAAPAATPAAAAAVPPAAGPPAAPAAATVSPTEAAPAGDEATARPTAMDLPPPVRLTPAAPPRPEPQREPESGAEVVELAGRMRRWRAATLVAGVIAACLLAVVVVQETNPDLLPAALQSKAKTVEVVKTVEVPSPRPAEFVAVLQNDADSPAFLLTFDLDKRMLTVRAVGAERQSGKSYELWLVSDKYAAPRSLGVIGTAPYTVRPTAPEYDAVTLNRATYAVSLEPEGGSPTGTPTGPVLYSGRLMQATAPDFPARMP